MLFNFLTEKLCIGVHATSNMREEEDKMINDGMEVDAYFNSRAYQSLLRQERKRQTHDWEMQTTFTHHPELCNCDACMGFMESDFEDQVERDNEAHAELIREIRDLF